MVSKDANIQYHLFNYHKSRTGIILDVAMTVIVMLFASSYGRLLVPEANLLRLVKRSAQQQVQESNEF